MAAKADADQAKEPAKEDLGPCSNCGEPAVIKIDDGTANPVQFCMNHKPDNA